MKDKNKPPKKNKQLKKVVKVRTVMMVVAFTICLITLTYQAAVESIPQNADISYNEFLEKVENDEVKSIRETEGQEIMVVTLTDDSQVTLMNPDYDEFRVDMLERGIEFEYAKSSPLNAILSVLVYVPTLLLTFTIVIYLLSSLGGQNTTLYKAARPEDVVTFNDVAGMSETKEEVRFAVSQLKNREKLAALGTRPCKGIILEGPPGTGKTLLAKAIAGEAGVPFISCCGADFIEMFVGLGAARVRSLWEVAVINAPCVLFIDEIDAVGRRRTGGGDGASTEANQTLNALLQRMDGLGAKDGIFVIGATNRIEDLDPALLRPGRFDKHLYVGLPRSKKDRDEIVKLYTKNKTFDETFDFDKASKLMFGLSGAQIEQVMNESVLISVHNGRDGIVSLKDIDEAAMKLRAQGIKVKHSSQKDIDITAVHEAGHAIVNVLLGREVSKISIVPYSSGVGGMTVQDTDKLEDIKMKTRSEMIDDIKTLLAGRMAEKLIFNDVSIGCSNDIDVASKIAYTVLNKFAMDDSRLVNTEAIKELVPSMITDSNQAVESINELLIKCNKAVEDMLRENMVGLQKLADLLKREEIVLNFNIEELHKMQSEATVESMQ